MHETIVARSIFSAVSAKAAELNARPISAKISCGQLNPINDEILKFAFEAAAKGTVCEQMKLEVVHIPLKATCKKCGKGFDFDIYSPACENCRSEDFEIAPDAPLLLEEIEFEDT
ncbi:MAG TPA: hydrogenase maturation nickel metallochaperone HypA [Planctomycetes bacterium]|nr:hydrogenase maturation nickel metallochaperone HypA [Planctomycetota bacterium]HIJ72197.1 hydrogenase maturation nickel metallochaperone HypA [Planctomycetota bacterium]